MNLDKNIQIAKFKDISLDDPFFESLINNYKEFLTWFKKKANELAYIMNDEDNLLQAFLYLKEEYGPLTDVDPQLPDAHYLKVGTFKINAHGTRLGERFIKKIFDYALNKKIKKIYVTIFPEHKALINLLENFGFKKVSTKTSINGIEDLLLKNLDSISGKVESDYPMINLSGNQYLLAIYPKFHTRLFPDSILVNEDANIVDDVSYTNSIQKIYICKMKGVEELIRGDALIIYRTKDDLGSAWYRAVATSLCMVEDVRKKSSFSNANDFISYCSSRSVFTDQELKDFYGNWDNLYVIKMTYNGALHSRIIRKRLVQEVGLDTNKYWGFMPLTPIQFKHIAQLGGFDGSLIVD